MYKRIVCFILLSGCFLLSSQQGRAQDTERRWAFGGHVGVNLWLTDYKDGVGGDGWELMLRYGVARWFSFGLQLGYEELKASNKPNIPGLAADYMKLHSFPASFVGTVHLLPGSNIAPFLYFGVGGIAYQRKDGLSNFVGGSGLKVSYHIPVGVGVETFLFSNVSFVVEGGYRLMDDKTDFLQNGGNDRYLEAKAGLNWYFAKKRPCEGIDDDSDDPDKDGLTMDQEKEHGTDPCRSDTDGDGLSDGDEVMQYHTDPLKADTDGDGLNDGAEVMQYHTDPLKADTDGDGLSDGEEVTNYHTDPLKADTDGDGLKDGEEIAGIRVVLNVAGQPAETKLCKTDPLSDDSDKDGLTDGDEVLTYNTDPLNPDTDGDGCSDGDEILKYHTDPLKKDCDIVVHPVVDTTAIDSVRRFVVANFSIGRALLPDTTSLSQALAILRERRNISVNIVGHADSTGSDALNLRLSRQRAEVVKTWLAKRGIDPSRMFTDGKGSSEPIETNSTVEGRAKNRRVEIQKR